MAPRRSQLERQLDVLRILADQGPLRPTHITLKANLSWQEFKRDLRRLEVAGLINPIPDNEGRFYSITLRARELLEHMAWVETILHTRLNPDRANDFAASPPQERRSIAPRAASPRPWEQDAAFQRKDLPLPSQAA